MTRRWAMTLALFLCAGCAPHRPPPAFQRYDGLPVSGTLADARRSGFADCFNYTSIEMRCRRHGVRLLGQGPFEAAVDLVGGDGSGGFAQLTVWADEDQDALFPVTDVLEKQGWQQCMVGTDERGELLVYTRPGSPVWIAMDLSYWGKRRLRVLPLWNRRELTCKPNGKSYSQGIK